ncbi:MAG: dCTP deaminase domain-containing protein [Candidatus Izemoplasmataceae bacterium]
MRGFKIAKGYESLPINLPKRSTKYSAGYDIQTCEDLTINPNEIKLAKTGIKAFMQPDEVLKMYPRSSLPRTFGVTIPNNVGIVDADYYENNDNDGAIFISLINFKNEPIFIPKGTRIAQGIFMKYLTVSDEEPIMATRNGGFGSTGK